MINNPEDVKKEEDTFGLGCALEVFSEYEEVMTMIETLHTIVAEPKSKVERAYEKFIDILKQYQEQPHLLDAHLDSLLLKCLSIVRDEKSSVELKHATFKYLYAIVNVRGYKTIIRHLPHEVADFEMVLQMIESQDPDDSETWTTRYILLLWLSIIVMIPFHMSKFDGFDASSDSGLKTVMTRVLEVCKLYIIVPDKCRDAASYLVSKFLTRSDVRELHLNSFIDWCTTVSTDENSTVFVIYGTLSVIAMIFKHGAREIMLLHAKNLLHWLISADFPKSPASGIKKLSIKIIQRIGLTFLTPRLASWRYNRGNRSLAANLSAGDTDVSGAVPSAVDVEISKENGDNFEVPEEVEEVIDQLIQALASDDSIVRWSAAKGLGRVTGRLPKDLADDVVVSILESFTPRESENSWHGGCLALAELGRRGLLLPARLDSVVPIVLKALVYDEPRGYASVGAHIRDSACYVCWSFARAYDKEVLRPYVGDIAASLLIVTCFDREINCRRAGSAAFQENVGRQGTFPHGIDILTTADFFAVSARHNAYCSIGPFVGQFPEYSTQLVDHLVARKVNHWDIAIRELSAKTLHNVTELTKEYMIDTVLPILFSNVNSIDLNTRHGSIISISDIVHALAKIAEKDSKLIQDLLTTDIVEKMTQLIPQFRAKMYFRGLGGELMRQACSYYIEKCSLSKMPFHQTEVIDDWLSIINESLVYDAPAVRLAALSALPVFVTEYYQGDDTDHYVIKQDNLIESFIDKLDNNHSQITRMSYALGIGTMPRFILLERISDILDKLTTNINITSSTMSWAESRRDSIKALTSICTTLENDIGTVLTKSHIDDILRVLLQGLEEYTQDKRGDIGAWVREAAMTGLHTIVLILNRNKPDFLSAELIKSTCQGIVQQSVEKIDRTRALAGKLFYDFIYCSPAIPYISNHAELKKIFPPDQNDNFNWNSASFTFPRFVRLIEFEDYTYALLLGLIMSVGGMTETLAQSSSQALFQYLNKSLKSNGTDEIYRVCNILHSIFDNFKKVDRITVSIFRFLEKLFSSGCIYIVLDNVDCDFSRNIMKLIQIEINGCRDIYKLMDGISALCQFIQIPSDVGSTALVQLSIMLCHRQSYVRRSTATRLHEALLVYGDNSVVPLENLDAILNLISNTDWEDSVDLIRPIRNELCKLLGIRAPVPRKAN